MIAKTFLVVFDCLVGIDECVTHCENGKEGGEGFGQSNLECQGVGASDAGNAISSRFEDRGSKNAINEFSSAFDAIPENPCSTGFGSRVAKTFEAIFEIEGGNGSTFSIRKTIVVMETGIGAEFESINKTVFRDGIGLRKQGFEVHLRVELNETFAHLNERPERCVVTCHDRVEVLDSLGFIITEDVGFVRLLGAGKKFNRKNTKEN